MSPDLAFRCEAAGCRRGIVWGEDFRHSPCNLCGGRGSVSLRGLCLRIKEYESTVRRVLDPRQKMRPKTTARICGKVVDLVSQSKQDRQREMFE